MRQDPYPQGIRLKQSFEIIHVRPNADFGTRDKALVCAGMPPNDTNHFRFFDLPQLSFIVDEEGMPVWPLTTFLANIALNSRSVTGDTVRTYAEALVPWMAFISERLLDLSDANEETLGIYRASMANSKNPSGKRRYSSSTANLRIAVICSFYSWGQTTQKFKSPLGSYLINTRQTGPRPWRAHQTHRSGPSVQTAIKRMPRILSAEEIKQICMFTSNPFRLMLRWCVTTGMRRFEVCNLTLTDLPTPLQISYRTDGLVQITVLRKGGREHTVHVPVSLVEETNWYVLIDRPKPENINETSVFLNTHGRMIQRARLTREFRRAADLIGSDATLHHLRHTFAVHVLKILEGRNREGEKLNSLKTLQVLLGHANSTTTEIYLEAMETSSPSVVSALDYLYGATL